MKYFRNFDHIWQISTLAWPIDKPTAYQNGAFGAAKNKPDEKVEEEVEYKEEGVDEEMGVRVGGEKYQEKETTKTEEKKVVIKLRESK